MIISLCSPSSVPHRCSNLLQPPILLPCINFYQMSGSSAIEHKQRFHHSKNYILPTDDEESVRLQFQNDLIRELFDGKVVLCPVPIKDGDEVLDVAAGKASWAFDFLATYPNAEKAKILCIDITDRLFPKTAPPNVSFQIENVLKLPEEWTGRFSFVHQRLLMAALVREGDEWAQAVNEVYRVTKAGGWAQFCEANAISHTDFEKCGPASKRFYNLYERLQEAIGVDFRCSLRIEHLMRQAGFVNVKEEHRLVQLGQWNGGPGGVGEKHMRNILGVYRGFKTPVLKLGGLGIVRDEEDFDALLDDMETECNMPDSGCGNAFYIVTGQKPII